MRRLTESHTMNEMIALASPPDGFTLDPAKHDGLKVEQKLKPLPVFSPFKLSMSLEDIASPKGGQRVLTAMSGLQHKFKPVRVDA